MSEWRLDSIDIKKRSSWRNREESSECDYEGKICFQNGENDRFYFNLSKEQTQQYVSIIAEEVVRSANELGEKIAKSMGVE